MNTLLNGTVTLNVSTLTQMSAGESKVNLHPQTLIGGKLILVLSNGQQIEATVNEFHEVELAAFDPYTHDEIYDDSYIGDIV
ncbi:hypothetical protein [Bacillus infantis]|uniref:Uncharacterized protein n=1 Tax=Bacillus infantis TaxID=324767 RepID=A0A5D4R9Q0_9BACI|nr:hypothetical protein [Bacillus infantis]TYS46744.1 hypothetical protein FZD51_14830 [Bacillus infantis]